MPLHDHFHPPLSVTRPWEGFHSAWAAMIADQLNGSLLPKDYVALPHVHRGTAVEIDVAWNVRDHFEVQVLDTKRSQRLVAAIELVSPANKDRPTNRRTFASKCLAYLSHGIALIIVDVVTEWKESLHRELAELFTIKHAPLLDAALYATAYRAAKSDKANRLELWLEALAVGKPLPTLPLWLTPDLAIPVDLDGAYQKTCVSLRIE